MVTSLQKNQINNRFGENHANSEAGCSLFKPCFYGKHHHKQVKWSIRSCINGMISEQQEFYEKQYFDR